VSTWASHSSNVPAGRGELESAVSSPVNDRTVVRSIVEEVFSTGSRPRIHALGGSDHRVYRVRGTDYDHVVKFCREPQFVGRTVREITVLRWLAEHTAVPVPPVTASDCSGAVVPVPYLVTPYLGELSSASDLVHVSPEALRSLGAALGRLHSETECDGFGVPHVSESGAITGSDDSWADTLDTILQGYLDTIDGTPFQAIAERIYATFDRQRAVFEQVTAASLLHTDLGPTNVRFTSDGVDAIIDWERSLCGHDVYDLCQTSVSFFEGPDVCIEERESQFYAGYRSVRHPGGDWNRYRQLYRPLVHLEPMATFEMWVDDLPILRSEAVRRLTEDAERALDRATDVEEPNDG